MPIKIIRKTDKTEQKVTFANANKKGVTGAVLGYKVDLALETIICALARQRALKDHQATMKRNR